MEQNVRFAREKVDYYVALDMQPWLGAEGLSVVIQNVPKGSVCFSKIKQNDDKQYMLIPETYRPSYHHAPERGWMNDPNGLNLNLGFGEWMMFMLPLTIVLLVIGWFLLKKFFPFTQKTIRLSIDGNVQHNWRTVVVAVTFVVTVLLWVFDKKTGVGANTVAMLPIVVFAVTGVVTARDLQDINWSVIWMVAGGFALGLALNDSGLAENAIKSIPFGSWSAIAILIISGLICYLLSNFISNTATAALLVPILAVVCRGMGSALDGIGGTPTVLIGIAVAASVAMALPISTPPNAIAHSTGLVKQNQMMKIGLIMGIIGLVLGYSMLFVLGELHII